jgi:glycosyltransferase involved in cell wall biosynthesis
MEIGLQQGNLLDRVSIFRNKLAGHLQENSYRAIQFRSIWEGRVAVDFARGSDLIYEVNGFPSIELKYHYPGLAENQPLLSKLRSQELLLLLAAKLIITPSKVTKSYIESLGINSEKIRVIPNGADPVLFQPGEQNGNGNGKTRLIYIGTLAPWQGIRVLLQAMKLSSSRCYPEPSPLRLTLIGPARKAWLKRKQKLVRRYKLDGSVQFVDACAQAEIAGAIAGAEIAVAPLTATDRNTLQGCSPIKLFEYAACGKAIVAADLPAVREIFTDGENALLYNPRKPSQLRDRLLELAADEDLRERLGNAARSLILDRYTWRHAQSRLIDCYEELMD